MKNQLPAKPETGGKKAQGFCTPKTDKNPQKMCVPPRRVIPIIFLPGIMGSNLRLKQKRQDLMRKKNNIAWRPDNTSEAIGLLRKGTPEQRQMQLDPEWTEVDIYDPVNNPTGNSDETADQRHNLGFSRVRLEVGPDTPLLIDDPITAKPRKTKEQKAKERGWGEIFFGSYRDILEQCEERLNKITYVGKDISPWWLFEVMGKDPKIWQAVKEFGLKPITKEQLQSIAKGCWFPVHAMGYNWLQSNRQSGAVLAYRIKKLIGKYQKEGYECEKVILLTHSMGGLAARAVVHPDMGGLQDQVLGIVHGVMPAIGAAAAYKRMRCGFEETGLKIDPVPKVLGNYGPEVTAVLGNAPGGLELLPSKQYGNGWLQIKINEKVVKVLPEKGDPYDEIYKVKDKWYRLLIEEWINPARLPARGAKETALLLDKVKLFHDDIASTYHPLSFAHYGGDKERPSWESVAWNLRTTLKINDIDSLKILSDDRQGKINLTDSLTNNTYGVELSAPTGPGDQTVPLRSADHQLYSGKFSGIFRQTGYEHQDSYKNSAAITSTLYSLIRIIEAMKWSKS